MYQLHPYQRKLVNQARSEFAHGKKSVLIISPAGSGKSVIIAEIAKLTVENGGQVLFMVHRRELTNQIRQSFIEHEIDLTHCKIMTVGRIVNRLDKLPKPTLIITDETHHALAKTYQRIYDYYSDVSKVGFSASPWRMNGKGLHDVYDAMVEGPDVKWLIKNHYLAPFTYYSVNVVNESKLHKSSTGDYTTKSIDEAIGKTIFGDVIKTYKKLAEGEQAIVYTHSVDYSKRVAKTFQQAGISAVHVDAKTPTDEREKMMNDFKEGNVKIICNVDLISEGFNVPDCSTVILLRPTQSLVLFIQQSMRSMRYKPGKKATIIDHVANYTRFGLPDTDREWTLEDRKRHKKGKKNDAPPIKQCPFCYGVISAQFKTCPLCGKEIPVEEQEIQEDKNSELEVVQKDFKISTEYIGLKKPKDLKTYSELKEYARIKGYKAGWIYFQAKAKHLIKN